MAVRAALGFLTPFGGASTPSPKAVRWFPAVGLVIGVAVGGVWRGAIELWPPASKLAFLVLGPMLDFKLYLMYTRVFRPRLIFTIIVCVVVQVFIYTMIVHYLLK